MSEEIITNASVLSEKKAASSCQRSLWMPPINDALQTPPQCSGLISPIFKSDFFIIKLFLLFCFITWATSYIQFIAKFFFIFKMFISILAWQSFRLSPNLLHIWNFWEFFFMKSKVSIEKTHYINFLVLDKFLTLVKIP